MACCQPVSVYVLLSSCKSMDLQGVYHDFSKIPTAHQHYYTGTYRPCGQCIDCRLQLSAWRAARMVCESRMHDANAFLTLTFDDQHMPADRSLCTDFIQRFWKCFRRAISPTLIKHYTVGEYGDGNGERVRLASNGHIVPDNPHYHACVFGWFPADAKPFKRTPRGDILYTSEFLASEWIYGSCHIGRLTFESAAYCARYALKKVRGDDADMYYDGRLPEKSWPSRHIGLSWLERYWTDVYPSDRLYLPDGRILRPPPEFDAWLAKNQPDVWQVVEDARKIPIISKANNVIDMALIDGHYQPRPRSDIVRRAALSAGKLDCGR